MTKNRTLFVLLRGDNLKISINEKEVCKTYLDGVFGGLSISFASIISNMTNHEYLSPFIFSIGILLCIRFSFNLITKSVPLLENWFRCVLIFLINMMTSMICGLIFKFNNVIVTPIIFKPTFFGAFMTGVIIGLVAYINIPEYYKVINVGSEKEMDLRSIPCYGDGRHYNVIMTLILMFAFVYLKFPHCVVLSTWFGAGYCDLYDLFLTVVGNVCGGLFVGLSGYVRKKLNEY